MKENKKIISPDEFYQKMKEIQIKLDAGVWLFDSEQAHIYMDDLMCAHIYMDDLMCEVLENLGYKEGIKIFKTTPKWYS